VNVGEVIDVILKRFSQFFDSNISNLIVDFNHSFSLKIAILMMEMNVTRASFTILTCIEVTVCVPILGNQNCQL
jgi:hypothetical protein